MNPSITPETYDLLRLTFVPGLGPVLIQRLLTHFGSASSICRASGAQLQSVHGLGQKLGLAFSAAVAAAVRTADDEIALAERLGVTLVARTDPAYPPLLRLIPNPPPLLYVRGKLDPEHDKHALAVVGSRACTPYGIEQAERFSAFLAQCGLTIVSGGARGIDTAAHRAALRVKARTIVVMGCGLSHCYPPENAEIYDKIVTSGGAIISELPLRTAPAAENFPARNRIISGISLGSLIIEAARGSGALITARLAAEEHGREVMAIPGRIDSPTSEGSHDLIRAGGAALVSSPTDVLDLLEPLARKAFDGVLEAWLDAPEIKPTAQPIAVSSLTDTQRVIWEALDVARTFDELTRSTGLDAGQVRAETTLMEMRRIVVREGDRLARRPQG